MEEQKKSVYETLSHIDVNEHTEKKNGLTYLSWAWAWAKVKENYPDANYTIYESPEGNIYWNDGRTAWVKIGVTINGLEHIEYLPVMDARNNSLPLEKVTSWDAYKAIQRSLTKAVARHGLGLYIYAGEDLPESDKKPLSENLLKKCKELGIETAKVAVYFKKDEKSLTDEDLEFAISQKEARAK